VTDLLTTATSRDEAERNAQIAVLPVGSFEQHGDYLPLITDTVVACVIAREVAETYNLFLLPPVTISCSHEHAAWPGTVSISAVTLYAVINDIRASLRRSGIEQLVIVNGHGGNYVLRNIVQEASVEGPYVSLFPTSADWEAARQAAAMTTNDHEDMHAGELETSILLYSTPELVRRDYDRADWRADQRPYLLSLGMAGYTKSGVIGKPSKGAPKKGKLAIESLVDSFAETRRVLWDLPSSP
jgi:creatinine amidohydrolase